MDRLLFKKGDLNKFLDKVILKLGISNNEAAVLIGISGRTLRDWKREKYKPSKDSIFKLSQLSNVEIPSYEVLSAYWNAKNSARLGGNKTYQLYGAVGTKEGRSKGGKVSWLRRKENPKLLEKYTNNFLHPQE